MIAVQILADTSAAEAEQRLSAELAACNAKWAAEADRKAAQLMLSSKAALESELAAAAAAAAATISDVKVSVPTCFPRHLCTRSQRPLLPGFMCSRSPGRCGGPAA